MACSSEILPHDKNYLATDYDKHITAFQIVITKIQTFSKYAIDIVVFLLWQTFSRICLSIKVDIFISVCTHILK